MILKDLYNSKNLINYNNKSNKFINNQLLFSITEKNFERFFLKKNIKKNIFLEEKILKKHRKLFLLSKNKKQKQIKVQKSFKIIHYYFKNLSRFSSKIWNFKKYSFNTLKKYSEKYTNFVIPQNCRQKLSRNYYSYLFSLFARSENNKYKFSSKLYLKTFIGKLQKNWIKSSPIYSFFKHFKYFAFNQKYLLFYYFESHWNTVTYKIKLRPFKRLINLFISNNKLKTLKILKFYRRRVKAKRSHKKR